ncbi:MAG: SUMF1/EgtB/PvdO family nonheme iron enzyme [Gammaproteobacteria bacterium]|nr:SUMF1/EgtB/PvdO family nonheme iron enzyme [Gammaproteobacteria bacterium]MBI5618130.1 SUMF1/EgtB/PvdO family nonheme iron enzyme [Gammaproteobacteria bacterium]
MLTYDIAGAQIDGARDYQEDAFLITRLSGTRGDSHASLIIVADGMGGHAAGNVASNMAVQTFNKHLTANYPTESLGIVLREAVMQANNSITETVRETAALKGMGCTLVAAVLEEKIMRWVSVGDSHLYLMRNNDLNKKNADHSYGGFLDRMAEQGKAIEPETGFSRNMLMSALTGDDIADIDCPETAFDLQAGDRILVASDGLDTLSQGKILSYLMSAASAKECVDALLKAVRDADMPRQDNTTVIVAIVSEKADVKAASPRPAAAGPSLTPLPPPLRGGTATALPPRAATPPRLPAREAPAGGKGAFVAALAILLAAGAGGGWWWMNGGAQPPKRHATTPPEAATTTATSEPAGAVAVPDETPAPPAAPASTVETFRDALRSGGDGPLMAWVPAGGFMMGSPATAGEPGETPQHAVRVKKFAASVYEITVGDFARYSGRGAKADSDAGKLPVTAVSWNDAIGYAKWLSTQTGHTYRLPTEAEWEYAARANTSTPYWWGRELGKNRAHCFVCQTGLDSKSPTQVGRFSANAFGLYDTVGNVQEWTYDCWHKNYDGAPDDGAAFEGGDCGQRVVRGGAFTSYPKDLRSMARDKLKAGAGSQTVGIRVVRSE